MSDLFGVTWRISASWANKRLDCTPAGIRERCHAGCCHGRYWPPATGGGTCPRLGPDGCTFSAADRPVTCLLYPLRLNANNTLVLHDKAYSLAAGCCFPNRGLGPRVIEALRPALVELFGEGQADMVIHVTGLGRDAMVTPAAEVLDALRRERAWELNGDPPLPRAWPRTVDVFKRRLF